MDSFYKATGLMRRGSRNELKPDRTVDGHSFKHRNELDVYIQLTVWASTEFCESVRTQRLGIQSMCLKTSGRYEFQLKVQQTLRYHRSGSEVRTHKGNHLSSIFGRSADTYNGRYRYESEANDSKLMRQREVVHSRPTLGAKRSVVDGSISFSDMIKLHPGAIPLRFASRLKVRTAVNDLHAAA